MKPEAEQVPIMGSVGAHRAREESPLPSAKSGPHYPPPREGQPEPEWERCHPQVVIPSPSCPTLMRKGHFRVNMGSTWVFISDAN